MSDVEIVDRSEIVRREVDRESSERALAVMDPSVLDTIFASRDPKAIVQRIGDVSTVLMDAVHQRDLARRYGDSQSEFLHIEAWQFLSTMLAMTVVGVSSRPLPDGSGWEATAELRHLPTGRVLGARDGMCQRTEPSMRRKGGATVPENTIRQMAQVRAARAAARSVLGFIPKIGGFEITDPEAPATTAQIGVLHQLEREIGWTHEQGHVEAGDVASYKDLTREQAAELIDQWQAIRDARPEPTDPSAAPAGASSPARDHLPPAGEVVAPGEEVPLAHGEGAAAPTPGVTTPQDDGPATAEQWQIAAKHGLKSAAVLRRARELFPDAGITSAAALTKRQLAAAIEALL